MAFSTLTREQRGMLSRAVTTARREAEQGAREALSALAVDHHEPYAHMTAEQRSLRNALRAHGRQLGDARDPKRGRQGIERLAHEVAFEHWHRMLFARFLAENGLLIHPAHGVAVSIADCIDLAKDEGQDPWALAASFGAEMLPQIFRPDDPALSVALPTNRRMQIEKLLGDLPAEAFLASDALGWTYQYWQSEKKAAVNARGEAIGADDIAAVTQLFTEHYMVEFLLHNTLGAWHAGKVLSGMPELLQNATCEEELRAAVAIDGCDWPYLRFVRSNAEREGDDGASPGAPGPWVVAAGTYPSWPSVAREITILDPCLGSGHIFVTAFELMVALRRHEEGLSLRDAIEAVLAQNMFGLELDPRCTQIGVFAVALHAWKLLGERCPLPKVQIACSGLSVGGTKEAWVRHAGGNGALARGMADLYDLFEQAPLLGSLIDPDRMLKADLHTAGLDELAPVVEQAMAASGDETTHEAGIAAAGMVEAVRLLRERYTLVVTNPPWLRRGKHLDVLKNHADKYAPDAKQELATMFLSRALRWCGSTGSVSMVLPHNWLFLGRYRKLRETLLSETSWTGVAKLGEHAFESPEAAGAFAALVALTTSNPTLAACFFGMDASNQRGETPILASEKAEMLRRSAVRFVMQAEQLMNPDARIMFVRSSAIGTLAELAESSHGIGTFDSSRFCRCFWEQYPELRWTFQQSTPDAVSEYGGCSYSLLWESGAGELAALMAGKALDGYTSGKWRAGLHAWGKRGVIVGQMNDLPCSLFVGEAFDENASAIVPLNPEHIPAMWAYCSSSRYRKDVRCIDQKVNVTNATLVKVPFDLAHWQVIAEETYPEGLPEPQSNDPKQWLFHAHPAAMLAAGPASASPFGIADKVGADRHPSLICRAPNEADVLQVAVARLVGYRWPAELDPAMELDVAARDWVTRCDHLLKHSDDDGIVPINPMRGESQAEERLVALLRDAFTEAGADFNQSVVTRLIAATGSKAGTLTEWLLNEFFEQHCKLFHHRPFVWHLWDGRKDGFNVLVLYHRLAAEGQGGRQILEKVTYSYLKDWIDRQEAGVKEGTAGAEARLAAAITLQKELKQILEGEAPYDIFVRWKPLAQQPVGWAPDINDGVRLNIRPFLLARDVGKKGAGILKAKPNIKWTKDRGSEPQALRPQADYPWFWSCDPEKNIVHQTDFSGGRAFTGERWNDLHYTLSAKAAVGEDR